MDDNRILELFGRWPVSQKELLSQIGLFLGRIQLQNILMFDTLYRKILNTHGVIIECGVRYGINTALLMALRGIYEPYVRNRKIVSFDTFEGFVEVEPHVDGSAFKPGDLKVATGYETYLESLLAVLETQSPIAHIKKYELVKGDLCETLPRYFEDHPETVVAFTYIDVDLYKPTKAALEAIIPRMPKGGIIAFDEVNYAETPGETTAFLEVCGTKYRLQRDPNFGSACYIVIE